MAEKEKVCEALEDVSKRLLGAIETVAPEERLLRVPGLAHDALYIIKLKEKVCSTTDPLIKHLTRRG